MNPLIPAAGDVLWASAIVLDAVLVIAALISLGRTSDKRGWLSMLLLIVFVPFVGPVVSLISTHRRRVASARPAVGDEIPVT